MSMRDNMKQLSELASRSAELYDKISNKPLILIGDEVPKALKLTEDILCKEEKKAWDKALVWANNLRDGEMLYLIKENDSFEIKEGRVVIDCELIPIRTFDAQDIAEKQIATLIKGKKATIYGPITKDMVSHLL